jgi:hypothetical protein
VNFIFINISIFFPCNKITRTNSCNYIFISTIDSVVMLYFALVRSKLGSASVAWNSVTITDFNKLERIQRKFADFCHSQFFSRCGISL